MGFWLIGVYQETYLFRAACSELKTEIENNRKKQEEAMRRERTLLQHEVDILNQKLTQELLILKDDLKGMFDDRRMTVRSEQRAMESKVPILPSPFLSIPPNPTQPLQSHHANDSPLNPDPRTQLQNNSQPKQRLQIRSRRSPMGPNPQISDGHPIHGFHGTNLVTICKLETP